MRTPSNARDAGRPDGRAHRPHPLAPFLALGLLATAGFPAFASATTFDDITIEQLARASTLVIVGRVEQVQVEPHGPGGQPGIHTRALIRISETLKGEPRESVEVWVHGGRLGTRLRVVPGQATFRVGEDVALFLFHAGGGFWPTGMGRGKWRPVAGAQTLVPETVDNNWFRLEAWPSSPSVHSFVAAELCHDPPGDRPRCVVHGRGLLLLGYRN